MRPRTSAAVFRLFAVTLAVLVGLLASRDARAAGSFKLKSNEVNEVSGGWHLYVTIELPKAPLTAHQAMKFLVTKRVVYERSLVDGRSKPVLNRTPLENQTPSTESLDVDFDDASGKTFTDLVRATAATPAFVLRRAAP